MAEVVRYETEGGIAVITVDNPPVNALAHAVRAGIKAGIERAEADGAVAAIALLCAGRTFIAGADITEFGKPPLAPSLREVNIVQERSRKPIVAGIHGTALGGGLETALACHYRVALASARVGLPEVKLGILPGAGGTQRLPRLVGVERALEMICSGEMVPAAQAHALGIIDRIVDGDLRESTIAVARELAAAGEIPIPVRDRNAKVQGTDAAVFDKARAAWASRKRGVMAPQSCIAAVQAAAELPFDEGMKRERELFEELLRSDQSKAQRHYFFAERRANKIPDVPKDTGSRPVATAAVLGAGTMGGGIAMCFADAGIPVTVIERDAGALERGLATIRGNYERSASRGRFAPDEVERRMSLIRPSLEIAGVAGADIVIEAVFEDMAVKREVFARLDGVAKPGAILATNTSTLDIDRIAAATTRPQDVIGLHFFSPANVMRLLEVVRGARTGRDVIATCMALARRIGKVAVLARVCPGFIGNRMLHAYFDQATRLLYEGALPEEVDRALYDFGMAMGPFAMSDLAGIDVSWRIRQDRGETEPIADRLYAMGRYGQKTGAGYYRYEEGSRRPIPDPEVTAIVEEEGRRVHGRRREIGADEIVGRTMLALVNEGARILEDGIALRASDIDVVYVSGYGFPVWRGGPMFWAEAQGLASVRDRIRGYHAAGYGDVWRPAALIERLATAGKGFSDHDEGA